MNDLVIAVYRLDSYAGETTRKLVKVFCNEEVPEEYQTYEYEHRLMQLVDCL
jgi:hypothetical protein